MPSGHAFASLSLALAITGCTTATTFVKQSPDAGTAEQDSTDGGPSESDADVGAVRDAAGADTSSSNKPLACSQVTTGSLVPLNSVPTGSPATQTGGTVADGHFVVWSAAAYPDSPIKDFGGDLWIRSGRYEWEKDEGVYGKFSYGGTIKYAGNIMLMTKDCGPTGDAPEFTYSVTKDQGLTLVQNSINGESYVFRLARKP